jgi:hypothetical protein
VHYAIPPLVFATFTLVFSLFSYTKALKPLLLVKEKLLPSKKLIRVLFPAPVSPITNTRSLFYAYFNF